KPATAQRVGDQARRRGFAVRAGDGDRADASVGVPNQERSILLALTGQALAEIRGHLGYVKAPPVDCVGDSLGQSHRETAMVPSIGARDVPRSLQTLAHASWWTYLTPPVEVDDGSANQFAGGQRGGVAPRGRRDPQAPRKGPEVVQVIRHD